MNINRRDFLSLTTCCCGGFLLAGCSTAPITGRQQFTILPESMINSQAIGAYKQVKEIIPIKVVIISAIKISNPGILKGRYLFGFKASGTIFEKRSITTTVKYTVINIGINVTIPAKK